LGAGDGARSEGGAARLHQAARQVYEFITTSLVPDSLAGKKKARPFHTGTHRRVRFADAMR
jgi:hypothetical protein